MSIRTGDIPGYEGLYKASDDGSIMSVDRIVVSKNGRVKRLRGRILSPKKSKGGYLHVVLSKNGMRISFLAHRLVLMAFHEEKDDGRCFVNHRNGDKSDNRLENLEWCNRSENSIHAFRVLNRKKGGEGRRGHLNSLSKPVAAINDATGEVLKFDAIMDAKRCGYRPSEISMCARGKQKTHYGLRWEFI